MRLGIMQPYFFPYIGYWQLLNYVDEYVVFDDVNYIKRGWINRNNILIEGRKKQINLHIRKASQNRLIKDTKISQNDEDNRVLLETIKMGYSKAPYYRQIFELLERILFYDSDDLTAFLYNEILVISSYLEIDTRIILSSQIDKDLNLQGQDKIIDICKKRDANQYINAIGGRELYHRNKFEENGIKLKFLESLPFEYKQFENSFVSNLSIIDVMMFNDVEKIKKFLTCYRLID